MSKHINKQMIQIKSGVVRDRNITANDFAVILYFKLCVWRCGDKYEFEVSSDEMRKATGLNDKILNRSLESLFNFEYIIKRVGKRSPHKPILVCLNKGKFVTDYGLDGDFFTELPVIVLNLMKNGLINVREARMLYYIKSYINAKSTRQFCFCREERIAEELGISKPTVIKTNRSLVSKNLITITKHILSHDYQYDEDDNLIYTRFNNHYEINYENLQKLYKKPLS